MNSRSNVNESKLVNFSTDLSSTLNQLDTKDTLLTFPFDHIYACHSESSDRRETLQLDKEVEISTHCVVSEAKEVVPSTTPDVTLLAERLVTAEAQNKRLKELLVYHLDLIQQQNELLSKREKSYQTLKQENDTLKNRLTRMDRRLTVSQRQSLNLSSSIVHAPTSTVTSNSIKTEPGLPSKIMLNSFTELLLPDKNSFIFDSDLNKSKSFEEEQFDLARPTEPDVSDVTSFLSADLGVSSLLDSNLNCDNITMIENKPYGKKEVKTEPREALYTVTSNSGNPVIQRIQRSRRKNTSSLGSLSRMSKTSTVTKTETPDTSKHVDTKSRSYSSSKKSKMINTYGKSRSSSSSSTMTSSLKRASQYTGSLTDRLRLIDTTPTGEDPYQLGEDDMREQSPIPKLMLQKTNQGRVKICSDSDASPAPALPPAPAPAPAPLPSHRTYNTFSDTNTKGITKVQLDKYNLPNPYVHPTELKSESPKTVIVDDPDMDLVKTEPEIDWRIYNLNKPGNETSLCDFSYGETTSNLTSTMLTSLDSVEFQDLFASDSPLNLDCLNVDQECNIITTPTAPPPPPATSTVTTTTDAVTTAATTTDKTPTDKSHKRVVRISSLIGTNQTAEETAESKRSADSKRGRKRALSTTGLPKNSKKDNTVKAVAGPPKPKTPKAKAVCRGKKSPVPTMTTIEPYQTLVGDPDLSWYLGLDPDLKIEDIDPTPETAASTVEVPRWREKPYTSCYTMEGTENLDDKVFEKRHQKLEAEERRQLRWHMRRIREQRHVERLRQRQRDSWCGGGASPAAHAPAVYTMWPQPQRDIRYIEITDSLPVNAFGEGIPALPEADFALPWVRTSKAQKRSKRSKTLH